METWFVALTTVFLTVLYMCKVLLFQNRQKVSSKDKVPLFYPGEILPIWERIFKFPPQYIIDQLTYKKAKSLGPTVRFVELLEFNKKSIFIVDLNLAKRILIKDYENFSEKRDERPGATSPVSVLNASISNLRGEEWKRARHLLAPMFSTGKIKSMFNVFKDTSERMVRHLETMLRMDGPIINMTDIINMIAIDIQGRVVFGTETDAFGSSANQLSTLAAKFLTQYQGIRGLFKIWKQRLLNTRVVRVNNLDPNVVDVFVKLTKSGVKERESMKESQRPNDTLSFFLGKIASDSGASLHDSTYEYIASQALVLFLGFTNVQYILEFAIYEISLNPAVQDMIFQEIQGQCPNEEVSYEIIQECRYLEMVVLETLRKYTGATGAKLERVCTKNYKVPGSDYEIKKGTPVLIPAYAIQNDEELYPNPEKFDPQRFSCVDSADHAGMLTFGLGPKNCIGQRYSMVKMKTVLASLVRHFIFHASDRNPIPMIFSNKLPIVSPAEPVYVKLTRRQTAEI